MIGNAQPRGGAAGALGRLGAERATKRRMRNAGATGRGDGHGHAQRTPPDDRTAPPRYTERSGKRGTHSGHVNGRKSSACSVNAADAVGTGREGASDVWHPDKAICRRGRGKAGPRRGRGICRVRPGRGRLYVKTSTRGEHLPDCG